MPDPAQRLYGDGFVLRPWCSDDLESLLHHANDAEVSRGLRDRFPFPYTREDGEAFLAGRVLAPGTLNLAIEIDGHACGSIGAQQGSAERAHMAELGYWLGQAYWGQGLMTRVVGLFAPWVMDELRLFRLQAGVVDFNLGSVRVLEKNGFQEEGIDRCAVYKRGVLHDLRRFARVRMQLP
ncbi:MULTISPECIES: GNAT family N-acetyltransferase [Stenotrophomonas maltophilia group]|uniref:GNAT family N-acetyltransferase n=1 Tax=Stenotrophomonas forensis TaxID=2871169 RepID=A0ABY7XYX0_9GAMM|nr:MULTISPECIES: GNAT family protein [Stenotrophomonas]WDM62935.1 GNAT family N-acetyltransferase [Stenotrophomonas sp. DFS-20110405]HDS1676973.1 GNAT family N-acetyltransferase [Stenotrophomonas maltophilia]